MRRDLILFILLTAVSLWFPGRKLNILLLTVSCVAATKYFFWDFREHNDNRPFHLLIFFYGIWILISAVMHHVAMSELGSSTYITVRPNNVEWGLTMNKIASIAYILFPLFLFITINIFRNVDKAYKLAVLIPVIFIPSLIIAFYQKFGDIHFMNTTITYWLKEITGLSSDFNGFRLSVFLLIPLSILGAIVNEKKWVKGSYVLLTALLFLVLLLSQSRTGIAGIVAFGVLFPAIIIWVKGNLVKNWILYWICILIALVIMGSFALNRYKDEDSKSTFMRRIHEKYTYLKTFGYRKTLIATIDENSFLAKHSPSRVEMGRYAFMLTSLSPLSGWGPGGFWRNIDNIRYREEDIQNVNHKNIDNANNQYLQMSSELGIFGALINIIFHIWPLWMVFRIRNRISNLNDRWTVGIGFSIVSVMMVLYLTGPHIISVDILWIFVAYLSALFTIAMKYGYELPNVNMKVMAVFMTGITLFFIHGTYETTFGKNGYKSLQKASWWPHGIDRNHYSIEKWKEGSVIWCKQDAIIELPLKKLNVPETINLRFAVSHPNIKTKPVIVEYGGKVGPKHEMIIKDNLWKTVNIPITSEYIMERKNAKNDFRIEKSLVISFDVSHTWIPNKWGINDDTRELGVAVLIPELNNIQTINKN